MDSDKAWRQLRRDLLIEQYGPPPLPDLVRTLPAETFAARQQTLLALPDDDNDEEPTT